MSIASLRPYVNVNLDKQRKMEYDMNSMAELERVLDLPVMGEADSDTLLSRLNIRKGSILYARGLLWAGLLLHDPKITLQQAGALINIQNMQEVWDGIDKALTLFFQSQGIEIEPAPAVAPPPITGSGSGVSVSET